MRYEKDGRTHEIECDFIAGCDGFSRRVYRASAPLGVRGHKNLSVWLARHLVGPHRQCMKNWNLRQQPARLCAVLAAQHTRSRYYLQVRQTDKVED